MIMKKTIIYLILLGITIPGMVRAQGSSVSIQYVIGFGAGDLGNYITKTSFRGAVFNYQKGVNENLSAGIELGWNVFYERMDYDTYTIESVSLTGVQYRYSNILPMLVTGEYTLNLESPLKPYVNLGIGTMYDVRTTDMGLWRVEEKAWHFALKPEIGFLYELSPAVALKVSGKYYVGFAAGGLETQSYFALSAGIAFML
jgi:hypothetical protein